MAEPDVPHRLVLLAQHPGSTELLLAQHPLPASREFRPLKRIRILARRLHFSAITS
ncbi:hypothetical protein [Sorangium sp. So ce362]|uniref:hypothetical protein n=1 Tax=Sorangium sp. So ce362 TaxID=3133303 RepID=UPI003F6325F0